MKFNRLIYFVLIIASCSMTFAQSQNVNLIANVNDYPQTGYSDVWGYTAPNGDEYALLGVNGGVSIVNVTDTAAIAEADFVPFVSAPPYGWYDMKTYQNYMYVSSEGSLSILIVDLSPLPDSASVVGILSGMTSQPHNIFVDREAMLLYVVEDFHYNPAVRIFSLADPEHPLQLSTINPSNNGTDSHDVFAQDSVLYIAEGTNPSIGIFDVSDPANPTLIVRQNIPNAGYVHQVWVTEDNNYMVTTEETAEKTIKIWDIQDLNNITLVGEYLGGSHLAHNAYLKDSLIYISHYESGLKVADYSDPTHPVEVGFYDTYPQAETPHFNGAWGVYPFTQNGMIFISDMSTGLYVLEYEKEIGPQIAVSPPSLDFGNVKVGTTSDTVMVTFQNFGTQDLTVSDVSDPGSPFNVSGLPALPVIIPPNGSENFEVTFTPPDTGLFDATITFISDDPNDPSLDVTLSGTGFLLSPAHLYRSYATTGHGGSNPGSLLSIDVTTGAGTLIGSTGLAAVPAFGINSSGDMYAVAGFDTSGVALYRIDAQTGAAIFVGNTGEVGMDAIAFDENDVLFGLGGDPPIATLYTIDVTTGVVTPIGSTGDFMRGMAFDPIDGILWATTGGSQFANVPDAVYTISKSTGTATLIGQTGLGGSTPDILFDQAGNLYGSKGGGPNANQLISIDKSTGAGTVIGSIGFQAVSGMATFLPSVPHALNASVSKTYLVPGVDSLFLASEIANPNNNNIEVKSIVESFDQSISDTVQMYDDGLHHDSTAGDDLFGVSWTLPSGEKHYRVHISTSSLDSGYYYILRDATHFTSIGPLLIDHYEIGFHNPTRFSFKLSLRNDGTVATASGVSAEISTADTNVTSILSNNQNFGDIAPGLIKTSSNYLINTQNNPASVHFTIRIFSEDWFFWSDTVTVTVTGISEGQNDIPLQYALKQSYPNPFNPSTSISYQVPRQSDVQIEIYNTLGQKVRTLINARKEPGNHQTVWDGKNDRGLQMGSGVYLYRMVAGGFVQTRKMVLLK